jgi:hypothetical protein
MLFWNTPEIARPNSSAPLQDIWLAKSTLQKAVRRGDIANALLATSVLLRLQPDGFWRRLAVIALEDIGIADLALVEECMILCSRRTARLYNGEEWHAASSLIQRMSGSIKCRDACDALVIADLHPRLSQLRSDAMEMDASDARRLLLDSDRTVGERLLAAWSLCGTKKFPAANIGEKAGYLSELLEVLAQKGVHPKTLQVARLGGARTREGHPLSLPLIWLLSCRGAANSHEQDLGTVGDIGGWPPYAFDMHTGLGRNALRIFASQCTSLERLVKGRLTPGDYLTFVGELVFRAEGEIVDRRLTYVGSEQVHREAEEAHLTHLGVDAELAREATAVLAENADFLHACRVDAFQKRAS